MVWEGKFVALFWRHREYSFAQHRAFATLFRCEHSEEWCVACSKSFPLCYPTSRIYLIS